MHIFEVHSNESACRKIGRLGLEQVKRDKVGVNLDNFMLSRLEFGINLVQAILYYLVPPPLIFEGGNYLLVVYINIVSIRKQ